MTLNTKCDRKVLAIYRSGIYDNPNLNHLSNSAKDYNSQKMNRIHLSDNVRLTLYLKQHFKSNPDADSLGGELSWSRDAESEEIAKVDWHGLYI